jgi:hypothetical protein
MKTINLIIPCIAVTVALVALQISGVINVSWWLILLPVLWPVYLVAFFIAAVLLAVVLLPVVAIMEAMIHARR